MTFRDLRALREQRSDEEIREAEPPSPADPPTPTEPQPDAPVQEEALGADRARRQPVTAVAPEVRTLAARVSLAYAREFERQLLAAEEYFTRVTKEEGVPALIRLLRDPVVFDRWLDELEQVRQERRDQRAG